LPNKKREGGASGPLKKRGKKRNPPRNQQERPLRGRHQKKKSAFQKKEKKTSRKNALQKGKNTSKGIERGGGEKPNSRRKRGERFFEKKKEKKKNNRFGKGGHQGMLCAEKKETSTFLTYRRSKKRTLPQGKDGQGLTKNAKERHPVFRKKGDKKPSLFEKGVCLRGMQGRGKEKRVFGGKRPVSSAQRKICPPQPKKTDVREGYFAKRGRICERETTLEAG